MLNYSNYLYLASGLFYSAQQGIQNNAPMIRNYLKIAWRNITRQKWASLINIIGLAVGMTASILLFIYISYETSFDRFHENGHKVYRLISHFSGAHSDVLPRAFPQLAELAWEKSPLVSDYCRVKNENSTIAVGEQTFGGIPTLMADPSFPDFFTFPAQKGDLAQTLADPTSIAISHELAERLFGEDEPINQTLHISKMAFDEELNRWSTRLDPVRVGTVLQPMPKNTHLQFDVLMSYEAYDPQWTATFSNDVFVFLMVEGQDPDMESITAITAEFFAEWRQSGLQITHELQPLTSIHFGDKYGYDLGPKGNLEQIIVFIFVAVFILAIAIINFINLVTARSERRAVEASIRKVAGASRKDIIWQFLGESILMSLIAFMLAMVLVEVSLTPFARLLGRELSLTAMESLQLFISLVGLVILTGVLAGLAPAMLFSRFQPAEIMRGKFRGGNRNPLLRIVLVVVQFAISVILIVSITVFNRQVNYMKTKDLGYDPENVLAFFRLTPPLITGYDALRAELLQSPGILHVGSGQSMPSYGGSGQIMRPAEAAEGEDITITEYRVREGYREVFGLELIDGRWYDFSLSTDRVNYVINETAARLMGLNDPVGTEVIMIGRPGRVIGLVKDFHYGSLRNEIDALTFTAYSDAFYQIYLKLGGNSKDQALAHAREVFDRFDPNYNFQEWYLSERLKGMYQEEEKSNRILNIASVLAILIAVMGLLGLSSYIVMARKKEIGLRKILGASGIQIVAVLFRDIGRWVVLANFIAWPVAWYAMDQWLNSYPYRINVSWVYLGAAGLASLLIAAITISGHTLRAARTNPVESLKAE
jgi:putative ABC transport system permease protein